LKRGQVDPFRKRWAPFGAGPERKVSLRTGAFARFQNEALLAKVLALLAVASAGGVSPLAGCTTHIAAGNSPTVAYAADAALGMMKNTFGAAVVFVVLVIFGRHHTGTSVQAGSGCRHRTAYSSEQYRWWGNPEESWGVVPSG